MCRLLYCWTKTPGVCAQKDDMANELYPKYLESDLCILATPLYHYTVNARMRAFIERTLPIVEPFFVERNGVTSHPLRKQLPGTVVLSVAGFPEAIVIDQLRSYVRFLFAEHLVADIYRPSSELLGRGRSNAAVADVLEAARQAGRELADSKEISVETLAEIEQPLTDFDGMTPLVNLVWKTCIEHGVTLAEFRRKRIRLRPDSIESFLALLQYGFRPDKTGSVKTTVQYRFSGEVEGECFLSIDDGKLITGPGLTENPDVEVEAPFEVWMDIMTGKADGRQALMEHKYRVQGNVALLAGLKQFFR